MYVLYMFIDVKMLTYYFFTIGILIVSSLISGQDATSPTIICQATGMSWPNPYRFNIADVQKSLKGCEVIAFSRYFFNLNDGRGVYVLKGDKESLKMLMDNSQTTYIFLNFIGDRVALWSKFLSPENEYDTDSQIDVLLTFLKEYKISGIIMENVPVYRTGPELAKNVATFVTKLKSKMDWLKVGLYIYGGYYRLFTNTEVFDYNITNYLVDYYFVELGPENDCTPGTDKGSLSPINSTDGGVITLEQMSYAVRDSSMTQEKVYATLFVGTLESVEDQKKNNDSDGFGSYSQLCTDASKGVDVSRWCLDSTSVVYDQANYVKAYFSGIMLSVIEADDYNCSCKCQQFPITNSMISGWKKEKLQKCPSIDDLD